MEDPSRTPPSGLSVRSERNLKVLRIVSLILVAFFVVSFYDLEWSVVQVECPQNPSDSNGEQLYVDPPMELRFHANHVETRNCCCTKKSGWESKEQDCCTSCGGPVDYRQCSAAFCSGPRGASYVFLGLNAALLLLLGLVSLLLRYSPTIAPVFCFLVTALLCVTLLPYAWIHLGHNELADAVRDTCRFKVPGSDSSLLLDSIVHTPQLGLGIHWSLLLFLAVLSILFLHIIIPWSV